MGPSPCKHGEIDGVFFEMPLVLGNEKAIILSRKN